MVAIEKDVHLQGNRTGMVRQLTALQRARQGHGESITVFFWMLECFKLYYFFIVIIKQRIPLACAEYTMADTQALLVQKMAELGKQKSGGGPANASAAQCAKYVKVGHVCSLHKPKFKYFRIFISLRILH